MYTREEVEEAYDKLIYAQGLISFARRADFNMNKGYETEEEHKAEIAGALISIFAILGDYLEKASKILDSLQCGYEDEFRAIWNKPEKGGKGGRGVDPANP